ncbi:hypothetical protein RHOSPDRAFT_27204 [Rhodotorula sp. JG-1b]|nr:hypothetical protein RHOSPDRAFT_27204 [Rhodotorula sp. JG-1b]
MPTEPPVRITLRPPPHRDYLQGYPGIPPYNSQDDQNPSVTKDPLLPLPKLERQLAHLTGTVDIHCTTFPVRAKWLSVELEKIEVVPPPSSAQHGHGDGFGGNHNKRNKKSKGGRGNTGTEGGPQDEAKFVELIGTGPSKLWEAAAPAPGVTGSGLRPVISISTSSVYPPQRSSNYKNNRHGKKSTLGAKLGSVFSRSRSAAMGHVPTLRGDDEDDEEEEEDGGGVDEDGYGVIPEGSYPFSIPLPEGLPPSVEIEDSAAGFRRSGLLKGISYQIVASLAVKPPKKSSLKFVPTTNSTNSSSGTNGGAPTVFVSSAPIYLDKADILPSWPAYSPLLPSPLPLRLPWASSVSGLTTGETREATKVVHRGTGRGGGEVSIKATRMTAAFGPGDAVRLWVQVGSGGEQPVKLTRLDFVLRESLTYRYPSPANPSYIVRAGSQITDLVSASADLGLSAAAAAAVLYQQEPVAFEVEGTVPLDWKRMTVRTAKHIDISYHLKIRALLEDEEELAIDHWPVIVANIPTRTANGIVREIGWVPGLCDRPGLEVAPVPPVAPVAVTARDFANGSPAPHDSTASQARFRIANPSAVSPSPSPAPVPAPVPVPPHTHTSEPSPMAGFVPSTRAEEEKLRYYEQATRTRDVLQSSLRRGGASITGSGSDPDQSLSMSPTSPASTRLYAAEHHHHHRHSAETAAQVQTATRVNAPSTRLPERSSTTVAWSGSEAGAAPVPAMSTPPVSTALGRSLTVAEQEKARLYDQATSIARQRQAEARSQAELDEFEQAQDEYERRLIVEAEEERRREEERVKAEFEASERARIRAEEEQWRLEEEARRARAEAQREEKKRRAEQALADELRRFEEQRRAQSAQRAAELERQAEERRREDEMKRQRAEEMRRLDEERAAQEEEHEERRRRERALERARAAAVAAEQDEQRRRQIAMAMAAEEAEACRQQREEAQHRRRQEEEEEERHRRQEEQLRRQRELSEIEQLRANQQRLIEEAEELRRALAARSPHGFWDTKPTKSDDPAGYAPSTSAPNYSAAAAVKSTSPIQSSPPPPQPLARASSVVSFAPSMSAANATAEAYAQAIRQQASTLSDEKAAYLRQLRQRTLTSSPPPPPPAPPAGPAYPTQVSGGSIVSTLPPASLVSMVAPPVPIGYKTAAEEKEEARRRRAAEEATSPTTGDAPPPSYPAGSSVSTAPPVRSASEEKEELQRYYAAKRVVDTAQQSREAASAPAYPRVPRSGGNAPPLDSTDYSPAAASTESSVCQDDQRDPSIAAGKRAAPSSSSLIASSPWDQRPVASSPYASTANGALGGSGPEDSALNGLGGGSTRANFPDYESVTQQIYDYHQQPSI